MKKPDINKTLMQKALNEIKTLRSQVNALKEPVAIIGIGCRFPGMPTVWHQVVYHIFWV